MPAITEIKNFSHIYFCKYLYITNADLHGNSPGVLPVQQDDVLQGQVEEFFWHVVYNRHSETSLQVYINLDTTGVIF